MKKIYTLLFLSICISFSAQIVGSWSLNPAAGAIGVGPDSANTSWWTSDAGAVTTRGCLFDDSIVFNSNGTYDHYMDGSTWLETWQAGSPAEGCGAPIAPHSGGSYNYSYNNGVLTVNGLGAHLGLAKVHNGGEDGAPVNDQITYSVTFSGASNEIMTVDISFPNAGGTNGLGWWRYVYLKNGAPPPPPPPAYTVTFNVHTDLIAGIVSSDGIYIGGGFVGGNNALLLDDSDGDGVWSGSTILDAAGGYFTILNGNCSDWSCKEDISGQLCADASNYNDRNNLLGGFSQDTILNLQFGSCANPCTTNPNNETFDSGFPLCWSQETNDQFDWTVDANGTPSSGTGPSDDFTGGGNYMYTEASLPRAHGDTATMYSEVIDISGLTNPELRFLNHMYGSAIGTLSVDLWDASTGTNLSTVFTHSGDRGDQWNEELIMLSTTATTIQFSITAVLDTNAAGQAWPGDIAIDEFGVREAITNDLALVAAAVASGCDLTATEPIELWVVNQGLVAESAFDLSYAVNGGTPVVESITSTVNPGDTLKYVFTNSADLSLDGIYNIDFVVNLTTDGDLSDNALVLSAENYYTPMAPTTMGDTICDGDTALVSADGYSYWYDAATGGNLIGEGDELDVLPSTTTSYYAEAAAIAGHFEDFDSYNVGDYIVASDPNNWDVWPGGGAAVDMPISDVQGNGGNSLRVFNTDGTDVVLEFGEAFSTGYFYYATDMYIVGEGYFNFQEDVNIGASWNMSITFIGGIINVDVDGASVLTGAYPGNNNWFSVEFECDYSTGTWEVFTNGASQGTFINPDPVASVNIYPGAGVEYYLDNVEWGALTDNACRSTSRTEAVVTVNNPTSGTDLINACDSLTWIDGITYTASNNTATYTLQTTSGCDSLVTLDLTMNNSTSSIDVINACDSLTWIDGTTYTSNNNTATYTLQTIAGCDSIVTLDLTMNNSASSVDVLTACDSLTWIDGITYTSSNNTATYVFQTITGCDSIVSLDLTINNSASYSDVLTSCDSLTWIDGINYTSSNSSATYTFQTIAGCDSVVSLDLTINNSASSTDFINACDSLTWIDGTTYTSSNNTAIYTLQTIAGCDSLVSLDLNVNNSSSVTDIQTSCDSFTWIDGVTYTSSNNTATFTLVNAAGCDSLVSLDLTVNQFNLGFTESSTLFTAPPFSVQFNNNTPNLSNYNLTWDFGDSTIVQNNGSSIFHEYIYNGLYSVTLIAEDLVNGCGLDTLTKEDLIYCSGGPNVSIEENNSIIDIYPNPTKENITININNFSGKIRTEVYDIIGNRLQITNETTISLREYSRGIYLLKVAYGDRVEEVKVIKQ